LSDEAAPAGAPRVRGAALGFIFASALINAVSFGIMIPILPNLIKQFTHGDTAAASEWNVLFSTVWGVMQFVCGPVLGMLSDRFGRRPVLLISIFGLFGDFLFMAFAPSLWWLFVGRVLNGITAPSFSTANAYVADITPPDRRARHFGLMGSAFGFGFIVGPTIGGALGDIGLRLPFMVAAGLCLVNAVYGLLVLPESLPMDRRAAQVDWRRANPLGSLLFLRERRQLTALASVGFLFQLAHTVLPSVFVLYAGYRYGWKPSVLGLTFMATGICQILVQVGLVGPVVARMGERGALLVGLAAGATGFLVYAFAATGPVYLAAVPIFALTGFVTPGLQGLMTRRVGPQQQGRLQGVSQSLQGVASVLGPPLFGLTFAFAVRYDGALHLPGLPILISSILLMSAFLLSLRAATPAPAAAPA
jgi:MFS transporter, DHA1 family, tetracycline resistance protein